MSSKHPYALCTQYCVYYVAMAMYSDSKQIPQAVCNLSPPHTHTQDHVVDPSSATEVTPGDGYPSLQQCLELFTEPELLTKDEAW